MMRSTDRTVMPTLPTTCHSQPWALIRRNGISVRLNRDFSSGTAAVLAADVAHGSACAI
jgi:hypothetical protein